MAIAEAGALRVGGRGFERSAGNHWLSRPRQTLFGLRFDEITESKGSLGIVPDTTGSASDRVQNVLVELRATITNSHDDGGLDFEVHGVSGFARERQGMFRSSFFIAFDPDPNEASQFVRDHDVVSHGEVQFMTGHDGTAIRLLVELPYEQNKEIRKAAQVARALHAGWASRQEARTDLVSVLGESGIAVPPLATGGSGIYAYGAWSWGSNFVSPLDMYMFDLEIIARRFIDHGHFFALNHAGHGVNSYGLNLAIAKGPVAAFVQHGYGGVYMDPVRSLIAINSTYSRLHVLMGAIEGERIETPRWLIVGSTFRGGIGLIDLERMRDGGSLENSRPAVQQRIRGIRRSVAAKLSLSSSDLGPGVERHVVARATKRRTITIEPEDRNQHSGPKVPQ